MRKQVCVSIAGALSALLSSCSMPIGVESDYSAPVPMTAGIRSGSHAINRDSVDAFLNNPKTASRKQIKTASLTIEAEDVAVAVAKSKEVVKRRGGYVEDSSEREEGRTSLDVRLPAAKLELAVDELAELGHVTYRRVRIKDVTDTYTDVQARLKNLRLLRERLRGLYKKAGSVKEMLEVEKELARVQTELDTAEARLKNLRKNVQHSELSLSIRKKQVPGPLKLVGKSIRWVSKKLWVLN